MRVTMPGLTAIDHEFAVPLDHAEPDGPALTVFAREVVDPAKAGDDLPWAVFLQGGPGGKSPRLGGPAQFAHVLKTHRLLLLDQRGTGRSSPLNAATVEGLDDKELARRLSHYRADAIVADAEHIRRALGVDKWETWGQSYGGFITLTYLSQAPEGLRACYVTGGLAGLEASAEEVYARTYPRVRSKIEQYYRRYPADRERVRRIAEHLAATEVLLPDGDRLTPARFRTLGMALGMSDGWEKIHWLLDEAWSGSRLSAGFLYDTMITTGFHDNPLYSVLHESIYAQGEATGWAADRLLPAELTEPDMFTGEMIYSWMFDDIRALRPFRGAAELLAAKSDWPPLYDPVRLAANEVPVAAAVYFDDMYVDAQLSLDTAARVGNTKVWVTNEYEHNGLRADGPAITERLMGLVSGHC
ncbi:alpha/beta fold hydrolase [Nonomuraea sp. NPDC050328]|uniref:alpha/beta fold hydrolase n=1 Tax=Nonomuraea sp. NPDC050328 TaxID=3364361 RepID=UPI00379A05D5